MKIPNLQTFGVNQNFRVQFFELNFRKCDLKTNMVNFSIEFFLDSDFYEINHHRVIVSPLKSIKFPSSSSEWKKNHFQVFVIFSQVFDHRSFNNFTS